MYEQLKLPLDSMMTQPDNALSRAEQSRAEQSRAEQLAR